jgi:hypothetical protein
MTVTPINNHDHPEDVPVANATGTSAEVVDLEATRSRAPAREEAPDATPNATPEVADRDRLAELGELFRPPELWSEPRPSLQQIWNYARHGAWTADEPGRVTAARVAGVAYGVVVIAVHAVTYSLNWVVERPGRLLVAGGLAALLGLAWLT